MLRIDEVYVAGTSRHNIPNVVEEPFVATEPISAFATTNALRLFKIAATLNDFRLRQIFYASDALCGIGKIFAGSRHDVLLYSALRG